MTPETWEATLARRRRGQRDTFENPIAIDPPEMLDPVADLLVEPTNLRLVEDRRTWHPEDFDRPTLTLDGLDAPAVVSPSDPVRPGALPSTLSFADPRATVVCVRRRQRREVLFALNKMRRGRGGSRRRDWRSQVRC